MPKSASLAVPQTYAALRNSVEDALLAGQRRVDEAKLLTYWQTGWFIKEHLLLNAERAEYGAQVIPRLSRDLKADERTLYECLKFARCFPILGRHPELAWAHYRRFIQVADPVQRKALMAQTLKQGWTGDQVAARVVELNAATDGPDPTPAAAASPSQSLLTPRLGTPGLHPVVARDDGLAVDLGFKLYRLLTPTQAGRFSAGDIVRLGDDGSLRRDPDATKADLFTYSAQLRRIIDGDTAVITMEVAPDVVFDLELRLRGLDCAEVSTPEGKAAKRFVQALADRTTAMTIATTKPDKYDRYLADVFLEGDFSQLSALDSQLAADGSLFLNNALLSLGHARPYTGTGPKPWSE